MPEIKQLTDKIPSVDITILNGQSESEIIELSSTILGQIYIPNTFEGEKITYSIGYDVSNLVPAKNINDEELSIEALVPIVLEGAYCIASNDLNGTRFIKLKSDTVQSQDCVITLIPRLK